MATEPTEKDRKFISSFVDYAFLLATETCAELTGQESILEKLKLEGKKLMEAGKDVGLAGDVERLVETVDDVVQHWALAPDADDVVFTKKGNSIYNVGLELDNLRDYFETKGLRLYVGRDDINGMMTCSVFLGEAEKIPISKHMSFNLYTTMLANTSNDVLGYVTGTDANLEGWAHDGEIYLLFEPAWNGSPKASATSGKLGRLAWQSLLEESKEDEEASKKTYTAIRINNTGLHECHHLDIGCNADNEVSSEAAALLYEICRGKAAFDSLGVLYDNGRRWTTTELEGSKLALRYLGDEGYREGLWTDLKPGSPEAEEVAYKIKGMADVALEKLEKAHGMPSHTEMERQMNIDFDGVYRKIAETVEQVVTAAK